MLLRWRCSCSALGLFVTEDEGGALRRWAAAWCSCSSALAMLGSRFVPPIVSAIGAPIEKLRGVTGRLARENAQRQPQRTATTAAALMIGVALVVFVGVFSSRSKSSLNDAIDDQIAGDLAILNKDGFSPIPSRISGRGRGGRWRRGRRADREPAGAHGSWHGDDDLITGLEPEAASQVFNLDFVEGRRRDACAASAPDEAIVEPG